MSQQTRYTSQKSQSSQMIAGFLVTQDVTLANGTKQSVLVPQVYVRVRPGDLDGTGALLAGCHVQVSATLRALNSKPANSRGCKFAQHHALKFNPSPATGQSSTAIKRPVPDRVMYAVRWPGPPKQMLVV